MTTETEFMYSHSFDIGTEVVFTQSIKTANYALRQKNRVYSEVAKGTKGVIIKADRALDSTSFGAGFGTSYTIKTPDGKTIADVPEYVLDFA